MDFKHLTNDFGYIEIEIPDALIDTRLKLKNLDENWRDNPPKSSTITLGTEFIKTNKKLALKVPCAILPMASNILINPRHKDIAKLKIIKVADLDIDSRLVLSTGL